MRLMLEECGLLPQHAVLVGLSGGVDSVVLLHLLCGLREQGRLSAVMAAHLHHGLRGAEADADAAFCEALCGAWDVPFVCGRAEVRVLAAEKGLSLETAAREERYAFLKRAAAQMGADCIAVAHNMDDQAETLLLHLLRGSGLDGLAGMRPRTGNIVRPLLAARRQDIEAYAQAHSLAFCTDATNASDAMTRNRVRHELLPLLCSFNPRAVEHLCATASLLAQDADYLNAAARAAAGAAAGRDGAGRKALLALPDAVRSRVLKRLLFEAQGGEVERRDVARLEALLEARTGTQIELRGGAAAWVDAERLYVGRPPQESAFAVPFAAPGRTQTPRGAFVAVADRLSRPGGAHHVHGEVPVLRVPHGHHIRVDVRLHLPAVRAHAAGPLPFGGAQRRAGEQQSEGAAVFRRAALQNGGVRKPLPAERGREARRERRAGGQASKQHRYSSFG